MAAIGSRAYRDGMKIAYVDDMPFADEALLRSHREELLAIAAELGITDVRVSTEGRLVGNAYGQSVPLSIYKFGARASALLEHVVTMYSVEVCDRPLTADDLKQALPL